MSEKSKGKPPDPPDKGDKDWIYNYNKNMQDRGHEMEIEVFSNQSLQSVSTNDERDREPLSVSNNEKNKSAKVVKNHELLINENDNPNDKQKNVQGNKKPDRQIVLFDPTDIGPYVVYVQNETGNIGKAHILTVAKLINNCLKIDAGNILNISSIGINRIKVEFSTALSANKLVLNEELKNKNYTAYIPQFLTRRKGVIKYVDRGLTEGELMENIKPIFGENYKLLKVTRINRKNINNEGRVEYIPTSTILVEVKGNYLPKKVAIHRVIMEVEPYIQRVVQCLRCLRYGHLSVQCKGKERCDKCGMEHSNLNCIERSETYCVICQGNHKATDYKQCPEYKKQKIIKEIMGVENISYKEAINKYTDSYSNIVQTNVTGKQRAELANTSQIKRRRRDSEGGNPLLNQHKEILSNPRITPTSMSQFNSTPQYHRLADKDKQEEQIVKITGIIINLIKAILNGNMPIEQETVNLLKTNIYELISKNVFT